MTVFFFDSPLPEDSVGVAAVAVGVAVVSVGVGTVSAGVVGVSVTGSSPILTVGAFCKASMAISSSLLANGLFQGSGLRQSSNVCMSRCEKFPCSMGMSAPFFCSSPPSLPKGRSPSIIS